MKKLTENLQIAAATLKAIGKHQDMMSHYDSAEDLGAFVEACIPKLVDKTISAEDMKELTLVFAPTCEWDNYVDGAELGEEIFQELLVLERELKRPAK